MGDTLTKRPGSCSDGPIRAAELLGYGLPYSTAMSAIFASVWKPRRPQWPGPLPVASDDLGGAWGCRFSFFCSHGQLDSFQPPYRDVHSLPATMFWTNCPSFFRP